MRPAPPRRRRDAGHESRRPGGRGGIPPRRVGPRRAPCGSVHPAATRARGVRSPYRAHHSPWESPTSAITAATRTAPRYAHTTRCSTRSSVTVCPLDMVFVFVRGAIVTGPTLSARRHHPLRRLMHGLPSRPRSRHQLPKSRTSPTPHPIPHRSPDPENGTVTPNSTRRPDTTADRLLPR
jgi:hypothetical protein